MTGLLCHFNIERNVLLSLNNFALDIVANEAEDDFMIAGRQCKGIETVGICSNTLLGCGIIDVYKRKPFTVFCIAYITTYGYFRRLRCHDVAMQRKGSHKCP